MARPALDTNVAIETPEHIVFHHRVAGPARRALAQAIDLALCYAFVGILGALLVLAAPDLKEGLRGSGKAAVGLLLLALFAAQWGYFVVWEGLLGRSPGKMAVGIRIVTTAGRPIGWTAAILRNLLRAADLLPVGYLTGVVSMGLTSRFQRIGDLVAGTMVVVTDSTRAHHAVALNPPASPAELARVPEEVSLDADERSAIELFLRRRPSLGIARATELAELLAPSIAAKVGAFHEDPVRLLALVHHRAIAEGRSEAPPSLRPRRFATKDGG